MSSLQEAGNTDIDTLQGDEKAVLQHYCSLGTEMLLKMGVRNKAPVDKIVINAYRYGIALGTQLTVVNGEIKERK